LSSAYGIKPPLLTYNKKNVKGVLGLHRDYKIEVGLSPHFHNNKNSPYYWTIFCFYDTWCNEGTGWAKTPTEA